MYTVVVVDDEPIVRMDISAMLEELGFQVLGEAGDGFDAVTLCRRYHPDVILMDVKMPIFDGLSAAETIFSEDLAGCIVLLTAYGDKEIIDRAKLAGVVAYLMKPVDQRLLLPTIEVGIAQSERLRQSKQETEKVRLQLEESRLIRRAQSILAKKEHINETRAYQILQKQSMDKRIPLAKLAQAVIEQEKKSNEYLSVKDWLMRTKHMTEEQAFRMISEKAKEMKCSKEKAAKIIQIEMRKSN